MYRTPLVGISVVLLLAVSVGLPSFPSTQAAETDVSYKAKLSAKASMNEKTKALTATISNPKNSDATIYEVKLSVPNNAKIKSSKAPAGWTYETKSNYVIFVTEDKPIVAGKKGILKIVLDKTVTSVAWDAIDADGNIVNTKITNVKVISQIVTKSLKFNPGFDAFDRPLDYTNSKVTYKANDNKNSLEINYKLRGAESNKAFRAGIDFYYPSNQQQCITAFGEHPTMYCGVVTRQGSTRLVNIVYPVLVVTDAQGNGEATIKITKINNGKYEMGFSVKQADCIACANIFQSTMSFGVGTSKVEFK